MVSDMYQASEAHYFNTPDSVTPVLHSGAEKTQFKKTHVRGVFQGPQSSLTGSLISVWKGAQRGSDLRYPICRAASSPAELGGKRAASSHALYSSDSISKHSQAVSNSIL